MVESIKIMKSALTKIIKLSLFAIPLLSNLIINKILTPQYLTAFSQINLPSSFIKKLQLIKQIFYKQFLFPAAKLTTEYFCMTLEVSISFIKSST